MCIPFTIIQIIFLAFFLVQNSRLEGSIRAFHFEEIDRLQIVYLFIGHLIAPKATLLIKLFTQPFLSTLRLSVLQHRSRNIKVDVKQTRPAWAGFRYCGTRMNLQYLGQNLTSNFGRGFFVKIRNKIKVKLRVKNEGQI